MLFGLRVRVRLRAKEPESRRETETGWRAGKLLIVCASRTLTARLWPLLETGTRASLRAAHKFGPKVLGQNQHKTNGELS